MTLYQHQQDGAKWLAARSTGRGYLADVPGTGKTRTAIEALRLAGVSRPLIVCPAIVRTHWGREFQALDFVEVDGLYVRSYDEIVRGGLPLMKRLFLDERIDALVLDEAHYIKHAESQRTLALLGRNGYARRLPKVFALSGTPIPKNPAEFWTTLAALFPEVADAHGLKTKADFIARFCTLRPQWVRGQWRDQILPEIKNEAEFKELLAKVMLRRTLDDVGIDVPALDWQLTRLDLGGDEWGGIQAEEADATSAIEDALADDCLDEIAADPHVARMRRRLGELKVKPVVEMLTTQLEDGESKVVVFAHHRDVIDGLWRGLAKFGPVTITGSTPSRVRDAAIDAFQHDPERRVFIGQIVACQTGITLTAARRAVIVEPSWTAIENLQAAHRIARIGQNANHCIVQLVALGGTLDDAIVQHHLREVRMAEKIFDNGGGVSENCVSEVRK